MGWKWEGYAIYERPQISWGGDSFTFYTGQCDNLEIREFLSSFFLRQFGAIKPTFFILIKMYTKDPTKIQPVSSSVFFPLDIPL